MAKIEIEIPDGSALSEAEIDKIPALKEFTAKLSDKVFKEGFQKGSAKKADELKPHLIDPAERERQEATARELAERRAADAERDKKYEEARAIRDAEHKKDLEKERAEVARRDARLRRAIQTEIKASAMKAGAREESLDDIATVLAGEVDLDENLEPFVKGPDGKAAIDGKNQVLTVEGRVRAYLDTRKHLLKSNNGQGGGAPGGQTFANLTGPALDAAREVEAIKKEIGELGASDARTERLFTAQRKYRAAQRGH